MTSNNYDYLIIGGGIAGVTAAETVRAKHSQATIGIISDEVEPLYSRVLLPNYLKKRIPREKLYLRSTEDFIKNKIDLRFDGKVSSIDTERKEVDLGNLTLGYGKLLIASGGRVKPYGKIEDQNFIFRLQTITDTDRLFKNLENIKKPIVIGGSFIALEFLEIFAANKISPTLLLQDSYFFAHILDEQGGEMLNKNFERYGIKVICGDSIEHINVTPKKKQVITKTAKELEFDAIAVGIGLDRNTEFLKNSKIEIGKKGVLTNEFFETNQPDVYAAGDVAEFYDVILGEYRLVGNWTNAFLQGKTAGQNMSGDKQAFRSISSYSLTNLGFQITALGECDASFENVVRYDKYQELYERFFIKNGVVVGAMLINCFQDKIKISKLIETKTVITDHLEKMKDFNFDIGTIAVIN